jgi:uncharacterized protein with LGFP repeats
MGYPSGAVSCVANGDCVQAFQHGSMLVAQGTAYPMSEAILTVYEDAGGSTGTLGSPNDSRGVVCGLVDSGCYMPFQNGSIYTSAHTPATIVTDAIRSRWGQTNAEWGWMGYPSAPASCGANGDCVQAFQHGSMLVVASTAYPVSAGIATAYEDAGGSTGPLGTPTDARGMVCGLSDGGCYMEFQHGSIYVSAHTPVTAVTDPIRARWGQTGWETGTLGYPTGPIACDQTTTDCAQPFQNGQILLVAGTAYPLSAAILTAYQTIGGSTGTLGAPTDATGMVCGLPDTGCSMAFQHGTIYTSAHTPAIVVTDPIATGWAQRGGAGGTLGYPTANASTDTNGTTATDDDIMSQTFQGGAITWNQSTGYTIT